MLFFSSLVLLLTSCNHLFYHPHPQIYLTPENVELEYEDIQVPVDSQVMLKAWRIKPQKKLTPPVSVIQFHGNAENRSTHFLSVGWLAEHGADVIVFDYRGYDGSSGSPSRTGLVDDGVAMLKWFASNFPNSRRFVIGQSLGGAVAIPAIVKSGTRIDGLMLESTYHSYRGIARMKLASSWLLWPFQWLPWIVLSADEDPIDYAARIEAPVLAFHDKNDPVVPFESGMKLYRALPEKSLTIETINGRHHTAALALERPESRAKALKFFGLAPARP